MTTGPAAGERLTRSRVALAVAAAVAAMLLYGAQFVLSRWSIQRTLSVWDLGALRFLVAGLLCLPFALRRGGGPRLGWARWLVLAVAAGAPYTLIMYGGLSLAPAAHGAVIIPGATPVVSALLAWAWLGERPWPTRVLGLAAIVVGLVLVGSPGVPGLGAATWAGDVLFAVAGVLWGLYTVAARAWRADPWQATAAVWALSLTSVPVYAVLVGPTPLLRAPRGEVVFQAIYQGVGVAIVALALYSFSIRVLGAPVASLFMPLTPVFGVLLGIPVLGEVPGAVQLVGMLTVTAGMVVAAAPARRARRSAFPRGGTIG
jgi:drug/metabolite transporter (DMT)-like permease